MKLEFEETTFKSIDTSLEPLDEFEEYYEYSLLNYGDMYIDYDRQYNTIISFGSKDEIIDKVSARALDYELSHLEDNDDGVVDIRTLKYLIDLYLIADEYKDKSIEYELNWLNGCKKRIFDLKEN